MNLDEDLASAAGRKIVDLFTNHQPTSLPMPKQKPVHEVRLGSVKAAIWENQTDNGSPYEPDEVKLQLHPYRLCLVKQAWYLIARPVGEDAPRTFGWPGSRR
jgi:hypothetical protein